MSGNKRAPYPIIVPRQIYFLRNQLNLLPWDMIALEPQDRNKKERPELFLKIRQEKAMKKIIFGIGLMLATTTATPVFAQAYCACWGTGNVIDEPRLEKTNGAVGYEMSVAPQRGATRSAQRIAGNSAYAYSPPGNSSRHMKRKQRHSQ